MHTTTLRQSSPLPDRPHQGRGRLQVPARGSTAGPMHVDLKRTKHTATQQKPDHAVVQEKEAVHKSRASHATRLAKTAKQAEVLSRALHNESIEQKSSSKLHKSITMIFSRRSFAGALVAIILVSTGYVTIDTWLTNRQLTAQATSSSDEENDSVSSEKKHDPRSEGRDETPLPANALATYSVAPDKPRVLYIDKLGVSARILPVGVNTDSSMQAPTNVFDTGWYTGSSEPGELGAVTIDGHSSGATKLGAFGKLGELEKGDTVTIEKGDGKKIQYKVVAKETVDRSKVDMRKFMLPYGDALRGANFITCSGDWTDDNTTMKQRTIVYTQQVG